MDLSSLRSVHGLLSLWRTKPDEDCQTVALLVAQGAIPDINLRSQSITQLATVEKSFIKVLRLVLESKLATPSESCIVLANALVATEDPIVIDCWWPALKKIMEEQGEDLLEYALQNLGTDAWLQFMEKIATIFTGRVSLSPENRSPLLQPELHQWTLRLGKDAETLKKLERTKAMIFSPAMQCILRGGSPELEFDLEIIISYLKNTYDESRWNAMQSVTARLMEGGKNSTLIRKSMSFLRSATLDGAEACSHVLEIYEEISLPVAEAMLAAWHSDPDLMAYDKPALEAVGEILGMDTEEINLPSLESLQTADAYIEEAFKDLLEEARRLESLRVAFKSKEPEWTRSLLEELGIEDNSPLDVLLQELPPELVDVVERVGDNEVELHFPLTNTPLRRKAMGASTAQSLLVRFMPPSGGLPSGFCMHFDNESKDDGDVSGHFPWLVFEGSHPDEPYCHGRATPAIFQLSRLLSQYISANGFTTLQDIYAQITGELASLGSKCIVCNVPHATKVMRRSTVCIDADCKYIFDHTSLDVRIADVREDPATVDLLLTMVYATACAGDLTLLPGCPIQNLVTLKQVINALPPIAQLQNIDGLGPIFRLRGSGDQTAQLLAWTCTSYRGYLASATDSMKIPSLPGSHQFILANAAPDLETRFATKVGRGSTCVMFHGTTLDRLHSILSQGLKDLSGTTLQRHGHSYGKGIYVSSDPATAWGYATNGIASWSGSKFSNYKVILGCELAGTWNPVSGNIHVITDPSCLMVRFVFLLPNQSTMPLVQHVTPAMTSIFASLRSGAL
jgi:hypothetical protein